MPYVQSDHLADDISLFALDCDDFRSHMCAVDIELKTPKFGHRSAQERFKHACGVCCGLLGGHVLIPAAAGFDFLFARADDEYTFRR